MLMLVGVVLVSLASCGGESDEERAQNRVCDARADVQRQLNELENLSVTTATLDGIERRITAIKDGVATIRDAAGDLAEQRRSQIQASSATFGSQVQSILDDLGKGGSLKRGLTELQNSLIQLRDSYQNNLAAIDCA
jgi:hypothetical protein